MLLRRNIFLLGTNRRLLFHCQSNVRILFRVTQSLPGGDPEREFEEGSFQFLLFDPQRRNTAGISSVHPGMLLACHPRKKRSIAGREKGKWSPCMTSNETQTQVIRKRGLYQTAFKSQCEVSWLFYISAAVIFSIFFLDFGSSYRSGSFGVFHKHNKNISFCAKG